MPRRRGIGRCYDSQTSRAIRRLGISEYEAYRLIGDGKLRARERDGGQIEVWVPGLNRSVDGRLRSAGVLAEGTSSAPVEHPPVVARGQLEDLRQRVRDLEVAHIRLERVLDARLGEPGRPEVRGRPGSWLPVVGVGLFAILVVTLLTVLPLVIVPMMSPPPVPRPGSPGGPSRDLDCWLVEAVGIRQDAGMVYHPKDCGNGTGATGD
jgi:hypothetical protein